VTLESEDRVAAVVLAAGAAQRFGAPKLMMPFGGSTVIGCVVAALEQAQIDPIIVVAGTRTPEIAEALKSTRAQIIRNPDPGRGMLSSVRVGVASLSEQLDRFLLSLGDQPRLQPRDILHLLAEHRRSGKAIAVPTHLGKRGHPVVFHQHYRKRILALDDDHTLRDVIHSAPDDVVEVELASDAVIRDIDTRGHYEDEVRRSLDNQ
jgi:molybdenum cofactor cytidylyltransferase